MEPEPVAPGSPSRDIRPVVAAFRSLRRRQVRDAAESTMSPQPVIPHQPTRDGKKEESKRTFSRNSASSHMANEQLTSWNRLLIIVQA